jgi:hypothetical protein
MRIAEISGFGPEAAPTPEQAVLWQLQRLDNDLWTAGFRPDVVSKVSLNDIVETGRTAQGVTVLVAVDGRYFAEYDVQRGAGDRWVPASWKVCSPPRYLSCEASVVADPQACGSIPAWRISGPRARPGLARGRYNPPQL